MSEEHIIKTRVSYISELLVRMSLCHLKNIY